MLVEIERYLDSKGMQWKGQQFVCDYEKRVSLLVLKIKFCQADLFAMNNILAEERLDYLHYSKRPISSNN